MSDRQTRRTVIGAAAASCLGLLAGCVGSDGPGGSAPPSGDPSATGSQRPTVDQYLSGADGYDGTVEDMTGKDAVTVAVGAEGNGGAFAFAPAAIRLDTGTTVTWVWTGEGSNHNVVAESGAFRSKQVVTEGHEFEHTFEESGQFLYYCRPHRGLGMKGAVVVE